MELPPIFNPFSYCYYFPFLLPSIPTTMGTVTYRDGVAMLQLIFFLPISIAGISTFGT